MQNEYASVSSLPFSLGTRVCFMLGKETGRQVSMEAANGKLKSLFAGPLFWETHTLVGTRIEGDSLLVRRSMWRGRYVCKYVCMYVCMYVCSSPKLYAKQVAHDA